MKHKSIYFHYKRIANIDKGEESALFGNNFPEQFEEYVYRIETMSYDVHSLMLGYSEENTLHKKITLDELTTELNKMYKETSVIYKLHNSEWFTSGCKSYLHKMIEISSDDAFLRILKSLTLLLLKVSVFAEELDEELDRLDTLHPEVRKIDGYKYFSILPNRLINQVNTDLCCYILSHFLKCLPEEKIKNMIEFTESIKSRGKTEAYVIVGDYYANDHDILFAPAQTPLLKGTHGAINQTTAAYIHFYLKKGGEGEEINKNNHISLAKKYGYNEPNSGSRLLAAYGVVEVTTNRTGLSEILRSDKYKYNHLKTCLEYLSENNHKKSYEYAINELKDTFFKSYEERYGIKFDIISMH